MRCDEKRWFTLDATGNGLEAPEQARKLAADAVEVHIVGKFQQQRWQIILEIDSLRVSNTKFDRNLAQRSPRLGNVAREGGRAGA